MKRQHTDKFSAEKCNRKRRFDDIIHVSRIDSSDKNKTRLSFPSDFSQVVKENKNANMNESSKPMVRVIRRSGTMREKDEESNRLKINKIGKQARSPPLSVAFA